MVSRRPTDRPRSDRSRTTTRRPDRSVRRRVGAVVASGLLVAVTVGVAFFQLGWPWWHDEGDRNHVHRAADGTPQHYQVHLPPQWDGRTGLPVVMAVHGCGMTGFGWNSMKHTTQFNPLADQEGFSVVYPTQRPFQSWQNCWSPLDPRHQQRGAGEPALLAGVVRDVVRTYGADPARVHVAGASSGAGVAVVLAATYPELFATATSVAGWEYGVDQLDLEDPDATPPTTTARQAWAQMGDRQRQLPMLVLQGGRDEVVPPLVGERLVQHRLAVEDLVDDGLLNQSLELGAATSTVTDEGGHSSQRTLHLTPEGRALVDYHVVPELGHAWPGPDGRGSYTDPVGPDASRLVWRFAQHHDLGLPIS
ncbi:esterase, PHB depolymerase family [Auraticoccus monumenti]|uniref:Esterase, PHB depolymerase family n=1 Tax=Auraticoccus monumenti TaxID=675864 RepID=A0A1G7BT85_9ACTN|nr:esterase, PHB depolymerase family [Auraticoccus monumenti]